MTAVDDEFRGLPDTVDGGAEWVLVVESEAEIHQIGAFRLPDVEDRSVEDLLALPRGQFDGRAGTPAGSRSWPSATER